MLRKITNIRVPSGAGSRKIDTKSVFATYDKQSAAFAFYFSDSNIAGATANLLFMIDGQKVFVDDGVTLSETNETHTFTYPLPDKLLNYTGEVDGYLYFDFEDGSHSYEIHFVFTIKKSQIDKTMEDAPDVYIKSFEEVKKDVQNKADQAKKDMQNSVDQVNKDYEAWKAEQKKENEDFQNEYKQHWQNFKNTQNKNRTDFEDDFKKWKETQGNKQKQFESDFQSWKDTQVNKQTEFEDSTNEQLKGITEDVNKAEDKVADLEKNLDVEQKNYFSIRDWQNRPDFTVTAAKMPAMKIQVEKNQKYTLSSNIEPRTDGAANIFLTYGNRTTVSSSTDGVYPDQPKTLTTRSDGYVMVAIRDDIDVTDNDVWVMLNKGGYDAKWTPHTNDIVTIQQYNKLEQAVIELGGSI